MRFITSFCEGNKCLNIILYNLINYKPVEMKYLTNFCFTVKLL